MFFKMLKSDLKRKKGLSVVLFLFITVASVLVFVGAVQIYQFITSGERNDKACKSSDVLVYCPVEGSINDVYLEKTEKILNENKHIKERYKTNMLEVDVSEIDFNFVDESKIDSMKYSYHYLTTVPREKDLLYTIDDKPFSVENGTVWVSEKMRSVVGAQVGDVLKITTNMGNVYGLKIAGFYKQPYQGYNKLYIISEGDYELLSGEIFHSTNMYGLKFDKFTLPTYMELADKLSSETMSHTALQNAESSDEYILSYILSIFIALVGVFLIIIVIMTIRFTMIAALKEEEREIGMLRAIGADSLRFRWVFAAKYNFFALIGGAIGITVGIPLSKMVLSTFGPGNIMPSDGEILVIGICSVLFIVALIIGFSLLVMRHINKISVVNAIRGENSAERFGKGKGLLLHRRKVMAPSFYLAAADLLKRFKRYVFLLIAYTLGALIILFVFNIKNTVINPDFLKYSLTYQADFAIQLSNEQFKKYLDVLANDNSAELWDIINQEIKDAGIPAHIDAEHYNVNGTMKFYGNDYNTSVYFGKGDISHFSYHEGRVPVHKDEVALSWSAASSIGIQLGDEIELKIQTNLPGEDKVKETTSKFTVTAFINAMDGGTPIAVIGPEYENPTHGKFFMATIIDTDDSQKADVINQLKGLYGEEQVLTGMEYTKMMLIEYSDLFDILEFGVGSAILFILILMTYLYTSVFIAEETSEIALLKSIGFTDGFIKASHMFRILILSVCSVIIGEILLNTLGQAILGLVMEGLGITGFTLLPEYFISFLVIPLLVGGVVLITEWLNLTRIKNIDICSIKDE